jgi:hypothetical protein
MRRAVPLLLLLMVLAVLHASFFSALGQPVSLINLPLVIVVALAAGLRAAPAVGAAIVAGTMIDTLSAVPYGTFTVSMVVVAVLAVVLFSTVLTHLSFFSYMGANAGAFLLLYLASFLVAAIGRMVTGEALLLPGLKSSFIAVLTALPLQLIICAVVHFSTARSDRRSSHFISLR